MMADRISIRGLRVFGRHGLEARERQYGQDFLIDVDCRLDLSEAAKTDLIENTVDYAGLIDEVKHIVETETYFLLEALAGRLIEAILQKPRVESVTVAVSKPEVAAQTGLEKVEVRMRRSRT
jgi:dihydroneopterin aldolase